LHSVETSEGTFLKRSKVSAVGLGAFSEYEQLGEEGFLLDLLLASDNLFNHLRTLLLGSSSSDVNALQAVNQCAQHWHFLHFGCCGETGIQKRN